MLADEVIESQRSHIISERNEREAEPERTWWVLRGSSACGLTITLIFFYPLVCGLYGWFDEVLLRCRGMNWMFEPSDLSPPFHQFCKVITHFML